jgi:hypothetical protein
MMSRSTEPPNIVRIGRRKWKGDIYGPRLQLVQVVRNLVIKLQYGAAIVIINEEALLLE